MFLASNLLTESTESPIIYQFFFLVIASGTYKPQTLQLVSCSTYYYSSRVITDLQTASLSDAFFLLSATGVDDVSRNDLKASFFRKESSLFAMSMIYNIQEIDIKNG